MKSVIIYSLLLSFVQLSSTTPINGDKKVRVSKLSPFDSNASPPTLNPDSKSNDIFPRAPKGRGGSKPPPSKPPPKSNPPPPPPKSNPPPPKSDPPPPPKSTAPPPPPPSSAVKPSSIAVPSSRSSAAASSESSSIAAPSSKSSAAVSSESSSIAVPSSKSSAAVSSESSSIAAPSSKSSAAVSSESSSIAAPSSKSSAATSSESSSISASSFSASARLSSSSSMSSDSQSALASVSSNSLSLSATSDSSSISLASTVVGSTSISASSVNSGSVSFPISASSGTASRSISASGSITSSASLSTITDFSSSILACQLTRGVNGKMSINKRNGCDPTQSTITEWESKAEVIKGNPKDFVCKGAEWPQACYHYYSVIQNNPKFAQLTCHDNADRHDGIATDNWSKQHKNAIWTKSYLPDDLIAINTNSKGKVATTVLCDRDEYPPAYFMPDKPKQQNTGQIVRWLPQGENKGAGGIWKGFCEKFDGGVGNRRYHKESKGGVMKGDLNENLVKTRVGAVKKIKGNDGTATTVTTIHATYTRAVFSMKFDEKWPVQPAKANNWGLEENACWPKAIVPEDPGFVLLTDDNWYKTAAWADIASARVNIANNLYAKALDMTKQENKDRIKAADAIKATWKRGIPSLEILEDGLAIRGANVSTRVDEREVEIVQCETEDCAEERRELRDEEIAAVIPGRSVEQPAELVPVQNPNAEATAVPQTLVKVVRAETGSGVRAELPRATGVRDKKL